MSISKQQKPGQQPPEGEASFFKNLLQQLRSLPQKKFLFASILLHALFFSLLFMHWDNTEPVKPLYIPSNIQAHVVNPEMLNALKEKQETEQKVVQEKLENEKKVAEQLRKEQQEKERAKQKAKEEALKKAAEEKKRAEQEKLKIKKQKEEKEKLEKDRLVKQKKLEEEQKKAAELAKEKERVEKKKEIQEKEQKMLEMLKRMEQQQALAKQQAELKAEQLRQQQAFQALELTEVDSHKNLIMQRIESLWRYPPNSDGLIITLRIRLLPNGELLSVDVVKSSGRDAYDRSAILAVKTVSRFPLPEDRRIFEKHFRQFTMTFRR